MLPADDLSDGDRLHGWEENSTAARAGAFLVPRPARGLPSPHPARPACPTACAGAGRVVQDGETRHSPEESTAWRVKEEFVVSLIPYFTRWEPRVQRDFMPIPI